MPDKIRRQVVAGCTSFVSCAYITVVNPAILAVTGAPFSALLTATVLVSAFSTLAMGLYAKTPIIMAPGMGLNTFFAYTMVVGMGIPLESALGAVFWSGVLFLVMSIFNSREVIANSIPIFLQKAIGGGIGLFIALIGLNNAGLIASHPDTLIAPAKLNALALTFFAGLALCAVLTIKRLAGAFLLGILLTTLLAIPLGRWWGEEVVVNFKGVLTPPDFSLLLSLDFTGSLRFAYLPALFGLILTDLLNSLSSIVGVSQAGGLIDGQGRALRLRAALLVDAAATTFSGLAGTSPAVGLIESIVGIQQGGRGGISAVVAGILFLPLLFFSPLLSAIPAVATAPVFVLVGAFMMIPVGGIKWIELDEAIPAFFAIILIPLTFSISEGIIWSLLACVLCKVATGKTRSLPLAFYLLNTICLLVLFFRN